MFCRQTTICGNCFRGVEELTALHVELNVFYLSSLGPDCLGNEYMVKYSVWSCLRRL